MDARFNGFKNPLARHFSYLITVSRISLLKQMLRFRVKIMKYSLVLHYGIAKLAAVGCGKEKTYEPA